jgi:hypothetical protein
MWMIGKDFAEIDLPALLNLWGFCANNHPLLDRNVAGCPKTLLSFNLDQTKLTTLIGLGGTALYFYGTPIGDRGGR